MCCWSCGVEPEEVYEVVSMEHQGAVCRIARWPVATDHVHNDRPPSPEELSEAGRVALARITGEWLA